MTQNSCLCAKMVLSVLHYTAHSVLWTVLAGIVQVNNADVDVNFAKLNYRTVSALKLSG